MRLNGPANIATLADMHRSYGSWSAVRAAGTGLPDGTLVVPRKDGARSTSKAEQPIEAGGRPGHKHRAWASGIVVTAFLIGMLTGIIGTILVVGA